MSSEWSGVGNNSNLSGVNHSGGAGNDFRTTVGEVNTNMSNSNLVLDSNTMGYNVVHNLDGQQELQRNIERRYNGNITTGLRDLSGYQDPDGKRESELNYFKTGYSLGRKEYEEDDSSDDGAYDKPGFKETSSAFKPREGNSRKYGMDYLGKAGEDRLRKELGVDQQQQQQKQQKGKKINAPEPDYDDRIRAQYDSANGWMLTNDPFGGGSSYLLRLLKSKFIDMSKPVVKFASAYLAAVGQINEAELHELIKVRRIHEMDTDISRDTFNDLIKELYNQDPSLAAEMMKHVGETLNIVNEQEAKINGSGMDLTNAINEYKDTFKDLFGGHKSPDESALSLPNTHVASKASREKTESIKKMIENEMGELGVYSLGVEDYLDVYRGYVKLKEMVSKVDGHDERISTPEEFIKAMFDYQIDNPNVSFKEDDPKDDKPTLMEKFQELASAFYKQKQNDDSSTVGEVGEYDGWAYVINNYGVTNSLRKQNTGSGMGMRGGTTGIGLSSRELRKRKLRKTILKLSMNYSRILKGKVEYLLNETFKALAENTLSLINMYSRPRKTRLTLSDIINCSQYLESNGIMTMFVQFMLINKNKASLFALNEFKSNKLVNSSGTVGDRMTAGTYGGGGDFNRNTFIQSRATQSNLVSASIENRALFDFFKDVVKTPGMKKLVYRPGGGGGGNPSGRSGSEGYFDRRTGFYRKKLEYNMNYSPIFDTSLMNATKSSNSNGRDLEDLEPIGDVRQVILDRQSNRAPSYRKDVSVYTTPEGKSYLLDTAILEPGNPHFGAFYERGLMGGYNLGAIESNSTMIFRKSDEHNHGGGTIQNAVKRKRTVNVLRDHQRKIKKRRREEQLKERLRSLQDQVHDLT